MQVNFKKSFNSFLDNNSFLNGYDGLRSIIKGYKKNNIPYLVGALVVGSVLSVVVAFFASVIGYGNTGTYFISTIIQYIVCIWISNVVFVVFIKKVRDKKLESDDYMIMIKTISVQVLCAILIVLIQNFVMMAANVVAMINVRLYLFLSIAISWLFTMLNALIAYHIFDKEKKIKDIFSKSFNIILKNWKILFILSMIFIAWTFLSNLLFSTMISGQLEQVQNINNIFHSLLFSKNYSLFYKVVLYNIINFIVSGFFELDFLLALAYIYDQDK